MTDYEARIELERVVDNEFPLIASRFIDKDIMSRAAHEIQIDYEANEWRGVGFPYRRLHDDFMDLIALQYRTRNHYDIFHSIGEKKVVTFLNNYYHWELDEKERLTHELDDNTFELTDEDKKDFEEFKKYAPIPSMEPLDIAGYLHMCRIAYEAAPMYVFPDFISDLYVVGHAKFDSCGLEDDNHNEYMQIGDSYPRFMHYHSEEMGFGGPYVKFIWAEGGWIMEFFGEKGCYDDRSRNMNIHRFLAMRRAGYPVVYVEK